MTMRFLCKNCWIAHEEATLLARCKRCVESTRLERLEPLSGKAAAAFTGGAPLVCHLHRSEPLDVFCGSCESAVPPRTIVHERSVVGLIGDTAAGKTSYLWVLSERLRQPNASGIAIRQALGDSDEQMAKSVRDLFEHGRISATPATDANVRNYAWELTNGARSSVIAFHDAAGEVWNELSGLARSAYERFYRYLDLMGTILFAIDGAHLLEAIDARTRRGVATPQARLAQAHEIAILDAVSRRVRARGVRLPAAAVITKADMLWERPEWQLFQESSDADGDAIGTAARDLLLNAGREPLVTALEQTFAPIRYFAVSAFGHPPRQPMRIEDLRPARVEEPLLALLGAPAMRR